jgi:hypothetical protein
MWPVTRKRPAINQSISNATTSAGPRSHHVRLHPATDCKPASRCATTNWLGRECGNKVWPAELPILPEQDLRD